MAGSGSCLVRDVLIMDDAEQQHRMFSFSLVDGRAEPMCAGDGRTFLLARCSVRSGDGEITLPTDDPMAGFPPSRSLVHGKYGEADVNTGTDPRSCPRSCVS